MRAEYIGYENNLELVGKLANDPEAITHYLSSRSREALRLYRRHFKK
jgi:hypothetical protein